MKIAVIGISDGPAPFFPPEVLGIIRRGRVFSGGKRHHALVGDQLPAGAQWIDITVPLADVFGRYRDIVSPQPDAEATQPDYDIVVFASGDPLFFGFANTLRRELPAAELTVFPWFNSLQTLAHRLLMPYHDMRIVSLTGRPWHEFDRALIERSAKIGVLTDREHTPAAIARRMADYGFTAYKMHIGEHLGHPEEEQVTSLPVEEAARRTFRMPNCVIVSMEKDEDIRPRLTGIPDHCFELLDGRTKMITKAPIRLLTLAALELHGRQSLWDVGFCTGSVSIEARLQFPHLHVAAFEIRPEGQRLMDINSRRFGVPGIETLIGDFLDLPCDHLPPPDAVFIGGHGGHLADIIGKACRHLLPGGVLVYNCVAPDSVTDQRIRTDSQAVFDETAATLGLTLEQPLRVAINDYHPIHILKARKS